jgi:osmotically-inducible protein OsmY
MIGRSGGFVGMMLAAAIMSQAALGCRTTQTVGAQVDDSWVTTKVNSKFAASSKVRMTDISVQTDEGIVTLTGRVQNDEARKEAVELARETEGVRSVRDHLEVGDME